MVDVDVVEGGAAMDTEDAVSEKGVNLAHTEVLHEWNGIRRGKDEVTAEGTAGAGGEAGRSIRGRRRPSVGPKVIELRGGKGLE